MNEELSKVYSPREAEEKHYKAWEGEGFFAPKGSGAPFTIVIPPPNVTGSLHMGHALNNSLQDVLIRFMRMRGRKTLWIPGTDHAGIATQNVVERDLKKQGKRKEDIGREAFIKKTWEWKKQYGGQITKQLRRLGASLDWKRECFTMDDNRSKAVRREFVSLYKDGLIYRGKRIINWCPRCKVGLANEEVVGGDCERCGETATRQQVVKRCRPQQLQPRGGPGADPSHWSDPLSWSHVPSTTHSP